MLPLKHFQVFVSFEGFLLARIILIVYFQYLFNGLVGSNFSVGALNFDSAFFKDNDVVSQFKEIDSICC
jgi:hypothetical protein